MVDRDLIAAKLGELAQRIARVRRHRPASARGEEGVLRADTAEALARAAGLRNVAAHADGRADAGLVFAGANEGLADLERFAAEVAGWVEERAGRD